MDSFASLESFIASNASPESIPTTAQATSTPDDFEESSLADQEYGSGNGGSGWFCVVA
ncbi:hypothetical protein PLICRDRAFT_47011 [Plicaturopsis crispa FD-325 SS-3]|uniref:Pheromone n=1 Tax=Plicaturopsis crispa FD-325 SS-3 TaxID=944288 RepID=A0A0C9SKJ0_PLICR|nr:hypothetical protein PLICRDRAFT_47011 [Plicaturopsis crispa FD-325 SS-3]